MGDESGYQEKLAASFGLLQLYNSSTFVIVSKAAVEQAMQSDAEAAARSRRPRWTIVNVVVDAVQRLSEAARQPFRREPAHLLRQALQGDVDAQFELAVLLETGDDSVPKDAELAAIWLQRAVQKRHLGAMRRLSDGAQTSRLEASSVQRPTPFTLNLLLDPFTRLWSDWRKRMALDFLFARFRLSTDRTPRGPIPYLLDGDYDDDDDDDF